MPNSLSSKHSRSSDISSLLRQLQIYQRQRSVAFFDAMQVGYLSSDRNAGFIIDVPPSIVGDPNFTLDDQKWRFRLNRYVIDRMVKIKEENNLQIDWQQAGMHQTARENGSLKYLNMLADFLDVYGCRVSVV